MTEQFYRDLAALSHTAVACAEPAAPDLTTWIMAQLQPRTGESVLNIGSRNSRLALALARNVGECGYVLAVDRSFRVLHALSQQSQEQGLEQRIRFLYLNLNDLDGHLRADDFDRALSNGALTQSKQPQVVFQAIFQALRPGGVFFFYGPSHKDLAELRTFASTTAQEIPSQGEKALLFMEKIGLPYAREIFSQVEILKFESGLYLDSPEALLACWRESAFYEEEREDDFQLAARHYFQSHVVFEATRCLVGIRARK